jgi:molecular chaperone GrpE (heat shock protein)
MEEATKRLEEHEIQRDDQQKQFIKLQAEFKLSRDKYEKEIESKKDEFEEMK